MITAAALALGAWMACAQAADINGGGLSVTWNNTVKYSVAARVQGRSAAWSRTSNGDDGDRFYQNVSRSLEIASASIAGVLP